MYKPHVSTEVLPSDALSVKGQQFYSLVEKLTSSDVSEILKIQCINSINTFLLCKNISQSILLPTTVFDVIRRNTCIKLDLHNNDSYVVHIGIVGQIDYLTELFRKKQLQHAKSSSKGPIISQTTSTPNTILPVVSSPVSTNASAMANHLQTSPSDPTVANDSNVVSIRASVNDIRSKIINSIDKWVISQKKSTNSNSIQLVDGINYSLQFSSLSDAITIVCQCHTRISVYKNMDGGFSLSNVYKHWKTSRRCDAISWFHSSRSSVSPVDSSMTDENDDDSGDEESELPSKQSNQQNTRSNNKRSPDHNDLTDTTTSTKRRRR